MGVGAVLATPHGPRPTTWVVLNRLERYASPAEFVAPPSRLAAVCEGTAEVLDIDIGITTDERVNFDYTYLPDLPFHLEEALYEVFETRLFSWPAAQEVSMRETVLASPYRGSKVERATFDYRGFDYTAALSEARSAVNSLLNGRIAFSVDARVHVVPMLIADHGDTPAAHFFHKSTLVSVSSKRRRNLSSSRRSSDDRPI